MELEFTPDQDELRAAVRSVLQRECPISLVRAIVEDGANPAPLWEQMVALDWPALTVSEEAGGIGLGPVDAIVLAEELGRVVAPTPLLATMMFTAAVTAAGDAHQQERLLKPIAAGERAGTLAISGAAGDWDPIVTDTTATSEAGGWRVTGSKHYVVPADDIVLTARMPDGDVALFACPASLHTPLRTFDASRPLGTYTFDHTPAELLADPGAVHDAIDAATTFLAAEMVGTCSVVFDIALQYAKDREQFGVKIGSFQAMKHKLADMYVALEAARATTYYAAVAIAEHDGRRSVAASMAKAMAGDCERRVCQDGIQTLGGIGYTWEHDMHLYVKRAWADSLLFGTAETHRRRVGAAIIEPFER